MKMTTLAWCERTRARPGGPASGRGRRLPGCRRSSMPGELQPPSRPCRSALSRQPLRNRRFAVKAEAPRLSTLASRRTRVLEKASACRWLGRPCKPAKEPSLSSLSSERLLLCRSLPCCPGARCLLFSLARPPAGFKTLGRSRSPWRSIDRERFPAVRETFPRVRPFSLQAAGSSLALEGRGERNDRERASKSECGRASTDGAGALIFLSSGARDGRGDPLDSSFGCSSVRSKHDVGATGVFVRLFFWCGPNALRPRPVDLVPRRGQLLRGCGGRGRALGRPSGGPAGSSEGAGQR